MNTAQIHAHFARQEGATQIASRFACEGLAWWLRRRRPALVWEIGAGIGTLSAVVFSSCPPPTTLVAEEPDEWCREQWREYFTGPRWKGIKRPEFILVEGWPTYWRRPAFIDFLILDGGDRRDDHYHALAERAVVFVEGNRRAQRAVLEHTIRKRRWTAAPWRPADRSKGYWVYRLEPTWAERIWFAAVRVRETLLDGWGRLRGRALGKKRGGGSWPLSSAN